MKLLNLYIIEKLHLNKDIKVKDKIIKNLTDLYEVGDICLYLCDSGTRYTEKIKIEVIKITNVSKTLIKFEYLTHLNLATYYKTDYIKINRTDVSKIDKYNYAFHSGNGYTKVIIPEEECLNILEEIREEKMEFDLYAHFWKDSGKYRNTPVVKLKDGASKFDPKPDNYEKLDEDTLNKMVSIIKKEEV